MKIVATTSLPAVDRPNADRWNAARSRQKEEKTDENSGHYVIASSRPPKRRTLAPIILGGTPLKLPQNNFEFPLRQPFNFSYIPFNFP